MNYTQKRHNQKIKRKNRISKRRKIVGGNPWDLITSIGRSLFSNSCLKGASCISNMLQLVFKHDRIKHEPLFEYDKSKEAEGQGQHGYALSPRLLDDHRLPYPLNRNLKFALNLNKSNIYICIVSSGGHTGTCIIFVYKGKVYCITYGVNKEAGGQYIAIRTPEYRLTSSKYSIILWEKFTQNHLDYIQYLYSQSVSIKQYIRKDKLWENIVKTNLPYAIVPINARHNCHSSAVQAVADINLTEALIEDPSRLGRTIFQQCMHAPNTFFYMCITPLVDLIVLAVTHGIFSATNDEASYRSIFEKFMVREEDESETVTNEKIFHPNIIGDIDTALREIDSALRKIDGDGVEIGDGIKRKETDSRSRSRSREKGRSSSSSRGHSPSRSPSQGQGRSRGRSRGLSQGRGYISSYSE